MSSGPRDKVAIKLIECKGEREVDRTASEMQILMTVSGHHNVVNLIESFYSVGTCSQSAQVLHMELISGVGFQCCKNTKSKNEEAFSVCSPFSPNKLG